MTGGVVVVLGSTGRNVAAGMTGGVAFLISWELGVHASSGQAEMTTTP
jgi:glutamate synthase (ferredoxin)